MKHRAAKCYRFLIRPPADCIETAGSFSRK